MTYEKLTDACHAWVEGFNAIPGSAIKKIWEYDQSIQEITPVCMYDRVHVIFDEYAGERGEVIGTNVDNTEGLCEIKLDNGKVIKKYSDDIDVIEQESWLPIWGTLWTMGDLVDEEWIERNLQTVADCGFRIYESEDFGILIGIDGAGYDFYGTEEHPSHWIKLYNARGLQWHKKG